MTAVSTVRSESRALHDGRSAPARPRRPQVAAPVGDRLVTALLAVGGGVSLWLAFPPNGLWPLALGGPLALGLATRGRGALAGAALGMLLGSSFLFPLLSWTGIFVGDVPWVALSTLEAGFYAALGATSALVSRLPAAPLWVAALWVGQEAARSRIPFGGFPWGRAGFSQADGPFGSLAPYGGVALVSFAVALTGTLLAAAVWRTLFSGAVNGSPISPDPSRSSSQRLC